MFSYANGGDNTNNSQFFITDLDTAADAFSEKITLQHNGDFGTNTGDLYYEWWIRDAAPLGVINNVDDPGETEIRADGTLKEFDDGGNCIRSPVEQTVRRRRDTGWEALQWP